MHKSALSESYMKINVFILATAYKSPAVWILTMTFDINYSIISTKSYINLNTFCQTHYSQFLYWRYSSNSWRRISNWWDNKTANFFIIWFTNFSRRTNTDCFVISNCTFCIRTARMTRS